MAEFFTRFNAIIYLKIDNFKESFKKVYLADGETHYAANTLKRRYNE